MNPYLIDTEFASRTLINAIFGEQERISQIGIILKEFEFLQWDFTTADLHEDFDEYQIQHKFNKMAKFHAEKNIANKRIEKERLELELVNKAESLNSLAMSLLQIAKQGISIEYNGLTLCPEGRLLKSESLKNVIWQGRNQSIHYEENNPHNQVKNCFTNLMTDFGNKFDIFSSNPSNKAKEIVELLEWNNYENYLNDMKSLLN